MKKDIGCKLLYGASGSMVVGFLIYLLADYYKYCTTLNSAPFWIWAATDAILWLIPAGIAFAAALVVQKKFFAKEKTNDTGK